MQVLEKVKHSIVWLRGFPRKLFVHVCLSVHMYLCMHVHLSLYLTISVLSVSPLSIHSRLAHVERFFNYNCHTFLHIPTSRHPFQIHTPCSFLSFTFSSRPSLHISDALVIILFHVCFVHLSVHLAVLFLFSLPYLRQISSLHCLLFELIHFSENLIKFPALLTVNM